MIDVSVPIRKGMPLWPGKHNSLTHTFEKEILAGDAANVSRIAMGVHTGTHVDAPYHHFERGARMGEVPWHRLLNRARVHDLTGLDTRITAEDLGPLSLEDAPVALFKTRNSQLWRERGFHADYVHVDPSAAEHLVSRGLTVVGIDYLSVERFGAERAEAHRVLLGAGILIVEGLDLSEAEPGIYDFVCLPLRLDGAEAAPARAVLLRRPPPRAKGLRMRRSQPGSPQ